MRARLLRAYIAGLLFLPMSTGAWIGIDALERKLMPSFFENIFQNAIFVLPLVLINAAIVLTVVTIMLRTVLKPYGKREKLLCVLVGAPGGIAWQVALHYAYPSKHMAIMLVTASLLCGLFFLVEATALVYKRPALHLIPIVGLALGLVVAVTQYDAGNVRAQLHGLQNAGYAIYVPSGAEHEVLSIKPFTDNYDAYKDGVIITLRSDTNQYGVRMYEQKVDNRPTPNCGMPFIMAENPYNDQNSFKDFTCTLVENKNGAEIYLLERKSYGSYYDDYAVNQLYFAIIGDTWIYTSEGNNSFTLLADMSMKMPQPAEMLAAFHDNKAMLEHMEPVLDFRPYVVHR